MQIIDGYCNEPNIFADDIGEYKMVYFPHRGAVV